jgi:hypothetical protein
MARALYERFGFTTFVASFSERDDLPSQWEDYADGGKGFAIGIDGRCVTGLWAGETALRLMPVEYNEKVQRERANEAVGRAVADIIELGGISSRWIEDTLRARFSQLAVDLLYMCATYKAARWADEREWRLLYHHNGIGAGLPVEIDRYSRLPKPFVSIDLTRTIDGRPRPIFEAVRVGARVHSIVCAHAEKMLAGEQPRVRWSRQRA